MPKDIRVVVSTLYNEMKVYLDNASTTRVHDRVIDTMLEYMKSRYGNPSSLHYLGREAKRVLEDARESLSKAMNIEGKVIFVSGATEANNLAIKGIAYASRSNYNDKGKGKSIIVSSIEHESILEPCKALEREGFNVIYLPVDPNACIDMDRLEDALRANKDTILVSIMLANNEVGTIQSIGKVSEIAHRYGALVHTDAAQALGKIHIDTKGLGIDAVTVSAHKSYGPKGIGALCISDDVRLEPIMHGGGHEYGLRSGTQNIPAIAGFKVLLDITNDLIDAHSSRVRPLRDRLERYILERIEYTRLNSSAMHRLPNLINVSFLGIKGEDLLIKLDEHGVAASTGSACSTLRQKESHVLRAMNLSREARDGSLRLTLGIYNTYEEIDYVCNTLENIVDELRRISPYMMRGVGFEPTNP
jgi:cysteine desulfurase